MGSGSKYAPSSSESNDDSESRSFVDLSAASSAALAVAQALRAALAEILAVSDVALLSPRSQTSECA